MPPDEDPPARITPAQRAAQKRQQRLDEMQEEIESGRLVVRQMTDEEREEHEKARAERKSRKPGRRTY